MSVSTSRRARWAALAVGATLALAMAGCGSSGQGGPPGHTTSAPAGTDTTAPSSSGGQGDTLPTEVTKDVTINFWHVYTGADGDVMDGLRRTFEKNNPHITVKGQFVGDFGALGQKVVSALQANTPPDVTIAYASDVLNYLPSGKLLDLTPYMSDKAVGVDDAFKKDVFPIQWEINRYSMADGKYLSFPFTANVLVMYYNETLLQKAGITAPPKSWEEFEQQCDQIKSKLGMPCYSATSNASTMNGFAGTFGADIYTKDGKPAFDGPEWKQLFQTLSSLTQKGAVQLAGTTGQVASPDVSSFVSQGAPFIFSTSRNVPFIQGAVGSSFQWGAAPPPQGTNTDKPTTVLYGPGTAAFNTGDPQRELASWLLMKYLTSAEVQGIWAGKTGNLPIRSSVAQDASYKTHLSQFPATQAAFDLLPNVMWEGATGPQGIVALPVPKVRTLITDAMTNILTPGGDPGKIQSDLQKGALAAG